jgi:glycine cleavage system transcriptional repressor
MAEEAVLVACGADRPGVVDELSQFLLECGGNITDSRAANLRGRFTLMLLVRAEPDAMLRIRTGLASLEANGIRAELHAANHFANGASSSSFPFIFTASGKDQAGVLHRVSHLLRVLNVNIDEIETHVAADASFQIRLALSVPRETPITMLRDYLTYLCNELGISGHLNEA